MDHEKKWEMYETFTDLELIDTPDGAGGADGSWTLFGEFENCCEFGHSGVQCDLDAEHLFIEINFKKLCYAASTTSPHSCSTSGAISST